MHWSMTVSIATVQVFFAFARVVAATAPCAAGLAKLLENLGDIHVFRQVDFGPFRGHAIAGEKTQPVANSFHLEPGHNSPAQSKAAHL